MELNVTTRTIFGKKVASIRTKGFVPAELFGHGIENRHLTVVARDVVVAYKTAGEHTVITLLTDSGERIPAIFSDVQYDYRAGTMLSIDFRHIRMDEKIQAKVPIRLTGEAPAKKEGFPIVVVLSEIELEALPDRLPHELVVDVSPLTTPGQTIYVRDLTVPADVKIRLNESAAIVTVGEKTKEEIVAPVAPVIPAASTETVTPVANTGTVPAKAA